MCPPRCAEKRSHAHSSSPHLSGYLCSQDALLGFHGDARVGGCQVLDAVVGGRAGRPWLAGSWLPFGPVPKSLDGVPWNIKEPSRAADQWVGDSSAQKAAPGFVQFNCEPSPDHVLLTEEPRSSR